MTKYAAENGMRKDLEITTEDVRRLAAENPDQAFVASDLFRPGFGEFLMELEYEKYTPDTPSNALFEMILLRHEEILFAAAAFPLTDLKRAKEIAAQFNLRIERGTFRMLGVNQSGNVVSGELALGEHPNTFIIQGTCERLGKLSQAEVHQLFAQREAELKRIHRVGEWERPN